MSNQTITPDELEKFTINSKREIVFYLQQLINDGERVNVMFNGGKDVLLTVLLDINADTNTFVFDWGGSETTNRKLLQVDRCLFVCTPGGVRNQFLVNGASETAYKGRPAFSARIPGNYTRLQRREYFRLVLPMTRRPPLTLKHPNGASMVLPVIDVSLGGIGAEVPNAKTLFNRGQVLQRARIEFKGIGNIETDLMVHNIIETNRAGKPHVRVSFQFVKLSNTVENQIQRFITDVQREERARLGS